MIELFEQYGFQVENVAKFLKRANDEDKISSLIETLVDLEKKINQNDDFQLLFTSLSEKVNEIETTLLADVNYMKSVPEKRKIVEEALEKIKDKFKIITEVKRLEHLMNQNQEFLNDVSLKVAELEKDTSLSGKEKTKRSFELIGERKLVNKAYQDSLIEYTNAKNKMKEALKVIDLVSFRNSLFTDLNVFNNALKEVYLDVETREKIMEINGKIQVEIGSFGTSKAKYIEQYEKLCSDFGIGKDPEFKNEKSVSNEVVEEEKTEDEKVVLETKEPIEPKVEEEKIIEKPTYGKVLMNVPNPKIKAKERKRVTNVRKADLGHIGKAIITGMGISVIAIPSVGFVSLAIGAGLGAGYKFLKERMITVENNMLDDIVVANGVTTPVEEVQGIFSGLKTLKENYSEYLQKRAQRQNAEPEKNIDEPIQVQSEPVVEPEPIAEPVLDPDSVLNVNDMDWQPIGSDIVAEQNVVSEEEKVVMPEPVVNESVKHFLGDDIDPTTLNPIAAQALILDDTPKLEEDYLGRRQ
ncbi:MAG: hypothetical protein E7172_03610 [Firmicutes bacterium]|nr:hypothetical protein [Bacillota bacterium]